MGNVEIVKYIYEKFKHGDAESILTTFAPDIEFRLAEGTPISRPGNPGSARTPSRSTLQQSRSRVGLVHCTRQGTRPGRYALPVAL